jgi:hypothetical protein
MKHFTSWMKFFEEINILIGDETFKKEMNLFLRGEKTFF